MTPFQLSLIAATGHEPPRGAHLIVMGVLIVGVIAAAVTASRRRRDAADESRDPAPGERERERSER